MLGKVFKRRLWIGSILILSTDCECIVRLANNMVCQIVTSTDTCRSIRGDPKVLETTIKRHGDRGLEDLLDESEDERLGNFIALDVQSDGTYLVVISDESLDCVRDAKLIAKQRPLNVESCKIIVQAPENLVKEGSRRSQAKEVSLSTGKYSVDAYLLSSTSSRVFNCPQGAAGIVLVALSDRTDARKGEDISADEEIDFRSGARNMSIFFVLAGGIAALLIQGLFWIVTQTLLLVFGELPWLCAASEFSKSSSLIWLMIGLLTGFTFLYVIVSRQQHKK